MHYEDSNMRYEGTWRDGKRTGEGMAYYKNGDKYNGEWKKGIKEGKQGTYEYANGNVYEG